MTRIFLALSALVWLPYGLFCFFQPGYLEQAAGVVSASSTGTIELRAMYGGLQAALGGLAAAGALRRALARHALVSLAVVCGGLGGARLLAAFAAGGASSYTAFTLIFEWTSAALASWLLWRR